MKEKNEVVEAVRERVRLAEGWSKATGYPPADYFDTMMDLRRMLHQYDVEVSAIEPRREAERRVIEAAKGWRRMYGDERIDYDHELNAQARLDLADAVDALSNLDKPGGGGK